MTTKRLPRRFDATMKALRELAQSKSERVRLTAVLRLSEILLEHQRSLERIAIAKERAEARREARLAEANCKQESPAERLEQERKEQAEEEEEELAAMMRAISKRVKAGEPDHDDIPA
jgi:hypothetical protein